MKDESKKIGTVMIALLMYVAVCADLIQFGLAFIPAVGEILPPLASLATGFLFFIWFRLIGVKLSLIKDPKKVVGAVISFAAEFVPVVDALPGWTILVAITIMSVNANISVPFVSPKKIKSNNTVVIPKKTSSERIF